MIRIIFILLVAMLPLKAQALLKITKPSLTNLKRETASNEHNVEKTIFLSLLQCRDSKDRIDCMAPHFVSGITTNHLMTYNFIFTGLEKVSEPFKCSAEIEQFIEKLEYGKYDSLLCFESSLDKNNVGYVFFKKENNKLKISKIKL